ncbi:MAG: N-6 DNA methylase [Myxococcota bacterium]|nr:N-6 DNA methylase [Myxococcota bacterium]
MSLSARQQLEEAVLALGVALLPQTTAGEMEGGPSGDRGSLDSFFLGLLRLSLRFVLRELVAGSKGHGAPAPITRWGPGQVVAGLALQGAEQRFWYPEELEALNELSLGATEFGNWSAPLKELAAQVHPSEGLSPVDDAFEAMLALRPSSGTEGFRLLRAAGSSRKTSGSYYTHPALVSQLLDSALEPLADDAVARDPSGKGLMELRVCDPACGSGRFLLPAARRLARRIDMSSDAGAASVPECLADVVRNCIFGVDLNPLAVDLCKGNLWLAGGAAGGVSPGGLEKNIRWGNALLGANPELLSGGIPDEAFHPRRGEDRAVLSRLRRRNRSERKEDACLPAWLPESSIPAAADLFCASFLAPRDEALPGWTQGGLSGLLAGEELPGDQAAALALLSSEHGLFHWFLEFPGGFDLVLGNPPWERVALQEKEFFATRAPAIAAAPTKAKRAACIEALLEEQPGLHKDFEQARARAAAMSHFLRNSGRFPLCGHGDVNTQSVFAELMLQLVRPGGRVGCIVPTGLMTERPTRRFTRELVGGGRLVQLVDFQNRAGWFPDVSGVVRFSLLTFSGTPAEDRAASLFFLARELEDLRQEQRWLSLSTEELALLNPVTGTLPTLTSRRAAELLCGIHQRLPLLGCEDLAVSGGGGRRELGPWGLGLGTLFHMAGDSSLFERRSDLLGEGWLPAEGQWERGGCTRVPLIEAKLLHHFNHRYAGYGFEEGVTPVRSGEGELADPGYRASPRYWVPAEEVDARLPQDWDEPWILGWRNICRSTDERTVIATVGPRVGFGHSVNLLFPARRWRSRSALLQANLSALVFDWCARQKLAGVNLTQGIFRQLPVVPPEDYDAPCPWAPELTLLEWLLPRAVELSYTAWDLAGFARSAGYEGPPFRWEPARRRVLRAELDAAFFHLYGLKRGEVEFVLGAFDGLARREARRPGRRQTAQEVLEAWDRLSAPGGSGLGLRGALPTPPAGLGQRHVSA